MRSITARLGHAEDISAIEGTIWRYAIINSGATLLLVHRDRLIQECEKALKGVLDWKEEAHTEKWHAHILVDIRNAEETYRTARQYLVDGDLLPS